MAVDKLIYYVKLHHEAFNDNKELNTYLSNVENDIIIFLDNNVPEITFKCHDYGDMYRLFSYKKKRKILNEVEVVYVNMDLPGELKEKLDYVMEDIVQMWAFKLKDTKYYDEWEKRIEEGKWWKE